MWGLAILICGQPTPFVSLGEQEDRHKGKRTYIYIFKFLAKIDCVFRNEQTSEPKKKSFEGAEPKASTLQNEQKLPSLLTSFWPCCYLVFEFVHTHSLVDCCPSANGPFFLPTVKTQ